MFRIGLKFPCNGLNRVRKIKKQGSSRLYLTTRCYETRARVKCEPEWRFFKDVKLTSRYSGHRYSTDSSKSEKSRGGKALLTLTGVAICASGILFYAKYNPEFRAALEGWVPGTDKTIQIIYETSYLEFMNTFFKSLKDKIISSTVGDGSEKETVAKKPAPPAKDIPDELMPANLVDLETSCSQTASKAIAAYQKATSAIQDYNVEVMKVVESADNTGSIVWNRLEEATEKRKKAVEQAEQHATEASNLLEKMYNLIDDPKLDTPSHMKTVTKRNIKKIVDDVDEAKKKYETEVQTGNITERYWEQVKAVREKLNQELQILFPTININEKKLSIGEDSFDLFVLYMYNKVATLQKEVEKLRTIEERKLRTALKASGDANQEQLDTLVSLELEKEKMILEDWYSKKLLEEQNKLKTEMRRQLKLQQQIHTDHLQEALTVKEQEAERNLKRMLNDQAEADSLKYKAQLATIVGRLRGLEAALKIRMEEERGASNAQILWSACQALARAVKSAPPGAHAEVVIRPLEQEIKAVTKAAPKEDPLVLAVIQGIPEEAAKRGVFPEDVLRARFLKVEEVARRLALVPEQGAPLLVYFLSYLQNLLIIKKASSISQSELEDKPFNPEGLNTYDILHRARYWLDRGDFKMTLRYMNLLKGASKSIARDWMNETRILLETQQAVDTLLAYAGAIGLVFLGAGDPKAHAREVV
ncbi:inner membrane mitochondrial protein mitofilin isoform X6 [Ptiloglossa arizonensis]|uniref:inner membrane mitochondrial protein mitofilin isoform X6 n=1 Tax=Ptiloglossa arizonensis TaxID=3350558 RepID=UPI003FA124AF